MCYFLFYKQKDDCEQIKRAFLKTPEDISGPHAILKFSF